MRLYIAGPMRGIPHFNFPAFFQAEDNLKKLGHTCFNPARRDVERHGVDISNAEGSEEKAVKEHGFNLREALHDDLVFITMMADGIALLPGWRNSKGANAEKATAEALSLEILYLDTNGQIVQDEAAQIADMQKAA